MSFKSVMSTAFRTMYPMIAAAAVAGGPVAISAAQIVGDRLGVKVKPEEIEDAVTTAQLKDPAAMERMQEAEQEFKVQMQKLGFENAEKLEQIAAEDRANARAREIAVKDVTPKVLAYTVTAGFFATITTLVFVRLDSTTKDVVMILVGVLGSKFGSTFDYFFGSSSGSAAKSNTIANQLTK